LTEGQCSRQCQWLCVWIESASSVLLTRISIIDIYTEDPNEGLPSCPSLENLQPGLRSLQKNHWSCKCSSVMNNWMRALPRHIISAALCVLHLQGVWSVAQSGGQRRRSGEERGFQGRCRTFFLISFGHWPVKMHCKQLRKCH